MCHVSRVTYDGLPKTCKVVCCMNDGKSSSRFAWARRDWLLPALIVLTAFVVRVVRLRSAPVGINGDELFNAVDALQIGRGNWPIYFEGNKGREALFIYLIAISMRLLGKTIFAFRFPAVVLGTGNVLLSYLLGRDFFNRRVGLLAAGLTAVSFWPFMHSRWGLRAVSLTFFTALTLYWLQRGLQSGRWRDWLVGGVALGLTLYTYIPSRIFPLVVVGWLIWLGWRQPRRVQAQWRQIVVAVLAALIVFAPFGWYMVQYPDKVNQRINNMDSALDDVLQGELGALVEPITAALGIFTFKGDHGWRYHLSDKPVFDPVTGLFFYAGVLMSLWRAFARQRPEARADAAPSYALLLLWLGGMLSPNAVVTTTPSFLRAAGAIVPVYLITAVAIDALYQKAEQIWGWAKKLPIFPILVTVGLLLTLVDTWQSYFGVWNHAPRVRDIYQADIAQMGTYLQEAEITTQRVFIAHPYAYDAAPRMLAYYTQQPVSWFMPAQGFAWGAEESWYLVPVDANLAKSGLPAAVLDTAVTSITFDDGVTAFRLYQFPAGTFDRSPPQSLDVQFDDGPRLIGYDLPETLSRGETTPITLHWQIDAEQAALANQLLYAQVQIVDENGRAWGQNSSLLAYPQAGWQSGDRFVQQVALELPTGLPPGPIYLRLGLSDDAGNVITAVPPQTRIGPFIVRSQPLADFTLEPDMLLFDDTLVLREAALSTITEPGLPINIALDWIAYQKPAGDYRVQFQLFTAGAAEPLFTQTSAILPDSYPPSQWRAKEQISSLHQLTIPVDLIAADTTLRLGMQLLPPDGREPVPITQGDNQLAEIAVNVRQQLYEAPAMPYRIEAQFGPNIQLLGYDWAVRGDEIALTLVWQALAPPDANYTIFNHLLGADGQLYGQFDSPPMGEAWLTSTWRPGEVIVEERLIPIAAEAGNGRYSIAIGLYTNENGRLPVIINGQAQPNDQLVLPDIAVTR